MIIYTNLVGIDVVHHALAMGLWVSVPTGTVDETVADAIPSARRGATTLPGSAIIGTRCGTGSWGSRMVETFVRRRAVSGGIVTAALFAVGVLCQGLVVGCSREATKYPEVVARDAVVTVDLAGIEAGSGRFHSYRSRSGTIVDFLVYRDSSGVPHAVLDACRTCYRWKKGYRLEGDEAVCIKCDMRFKLDSLAQGMGSCVPIRVAAEPRERTLVIPVAELEAGSRYF